MKKKIIVVVGVVLILAVCVWGCMEVRAVKKTKWEMAAVSIKIGTEKLEGESDYAYPTTGVLQQTGAQVFQSISSFGAMRNETKRNETKQNETKQCTPDYPVMIMVENTLYQDSGEISTNLRCGMMDGSITSVAQGVPTENDQSNFGTGYGYQYGMGTIEVLMEDEWHIFIPYDTPSYAPDWDSLSEEERMEADPMYFGE